MTEELEQTANPYNQRKAWQEENAPRQTASADTMFFEEAQPTSKATRSEATPAKTETSTNYKKRYDDLKKHYDGKVAEFKQKRVRVISSSSRRSTSVQAAEDS